MEMKAAVTWGIGEAFQIEDVELAAPKDDEILVKIAACGVCHTDEAAQTNAIPVPLPAVLGHEGCGVVQAVGKNVREFKPGDKVGMSFGFCGTCRNCRSGHQHARENFNAINFGGVMPDGTTRLSKNGKAISSFFGQSSFAQFAVVHSESAVKLPEDGFDLRLAAPLGCGIQTGAGAVLNRLRPEFGSSIAVFGCGTVGMSAIMAARIASCQKIIAVGGNAASLKLAMELGATHTVNRKETGDIVAEIKRITGGGTDYSIDASGVPDFVKKALASCRFMGTCAILGATGDVSFNIQQELMGEAKSLIGIVEGDAIPKLFIPKLIEYYRDGRFPLDRLLKFYPFEEINRAFKESHEGKCIKAVLTME